MPHDAMNTTFADLAERFDVSPAAVRHLAEAVQTGGGNMAMFDHPDLGGPGQWMRGGMIMVSGPDDPALRYRIDALCVALSRSPVASRADDRSSVARAGSVTGAGSKWWPAALGEPSATGAQNDLAYAYFDGPRRLAVRQSGDVALYDTGDHRITGVSQSQQGIHSHVIFTSQYGQVALDQLMRCDAADMTEDRQAGAKTSDPDIFSAIERLGVLRDRGLLTDAEFAAKKRELLSRL